MSLKTFLTSLLLLYVRCKQYPYVVSIQRIVSFEEYEHIGAGSIINPNWVLSTAYSVCGNEIVFLGRNCSPKNMYLVLSNTTVLPHNESFGQISVVANIVIHPEFRIDMMTLFSRDFENDLALFRLKKSLNFSKWIQPVRLATKDLFRMTAPWEHFEDPCTAVGWSSSEETEEKTLEGVFFGLASSQNCKMNDITIGEAKLCSLYSYGEGDRCRMDVGGPLVCDDVQVGIASKDVTWCDEEYPFVWTRLDEYFDWIERTMGEHNDSQHPKRSQMFKSEVLSEEPSAGRKDRFCWKIVLLIMYHHSYFLIS